MNPTRFSWAYLFPLSLILALFPIPKTYVDVTMHHYATTSGGEIEEMGQEFLALPRGIFIRAHPPLISFIGVPRDVFEFEFCAKKDTFYEVDSKKIETKAIKFDLRIKTDNETYHLENNQEYCFPLKPGLEYFAGNSYVDPDEAKEILDGYKKKRIDGQIHIVFRERPILPLPIIFIVSLITLLPLYWGGMLAFLEIKRFVFGAKVPNRSK